VPASLWKSVIGLVNFEMGSSRTLLGIFILKNRSLAIGLIGVNPKRKMLAGDSIIFWQATI